MNKTIFGQKSGDNKRKRVDEDDIEEGRFEEDFEDEDDVDDGDDAWLDDDSEIEADSACSGEGYDISSVVDLTVEVLRDLISDRAINEVQAPSRPANVSCSQSSDGPVSWNFTLE
jgi:hypothetical protein